MPLEGAVTQMRRPVTRLVWILHARGRRKEATANELALDFLSCKIGLAADVVQQVRILWD
jgi:hypothetical protein